MGAASTPARICPECGARNSGLSLFCAECGASLTNATTEPGPSDQTTTTFTPVSEPSDSDPYATQQFRPQPATSSQQTATGLPPAQVGWAESIIPAPGMNATHDDIGSRGMVLGWIAAILILLVIAFFAWSSLLDQGTRDSVIGIFT